MSQFLSPTAINDSAALTGTFMFTDAKKPCNLSSIEAGEDLTKLEESSLFLQDTTK